MLMSMNPTIKQLSCLLCEARRVILLLASSEGHVGPYPTLPMLWALFQQSNKTCERYLAICACAIWQERRLGPLSSSNHGRSWSASHALVTDDKHLPVGVHTNLDTMQLRCSSASALVSQARATRHCRSLVSSPSRFPGTHCCFVFMSLTVLITILVQCACTCF